MAVTFDLEWTETPNPDREWKIVRENGNPVGYLYREKSSGNLIATTNGKREYPMQSEEEARQWFDDLTPNV